MQIILYPAASILFYALLAVMPQIGIITAVFSPLILLLYLNLPKRNVYTDMIPAAGTAALGAFSMVTAGFYVIAVIFPAVFIKRYLASGKRESWVPAVISPLIIFSAVCIAVFGFKAFREDMAAVAYENLSKFFDAVKQAGGPVTEEPYFTALAGRLKETALSIVMIFPAFNYIFTAFSAYISMHLFAKMNRMYLSKYRLPDNLVWILILGFSLVFVKNMYATHAGLNLIMIMLALYAFQGFDIVNHWMFRLKIFPIIRALIFVFIFSEPPVIIVLSLLGLFSVWFNLYGKTDPGKEQKSSD